MFFMNKDLRYDAALITAVVFWGSSVIALKIAQQSFPPVFLCFLRFMIASCVLVPVTLSKKNIVLPSRKDMKYITLSSLTGITVYYALESKAVSFTAASDASLISASYPLITIFTGIVFFRVLPQKRQVAGILMAAAGVILLTYTRDTANRTFAGNLILTFDGFLWAFYNFLTQKISPDCDTNSATFLQIIIGAIGFLPFLLLEKETILPLSVSSVAALVYLSLTCTLAALYLYNYGLRRTSPAKAALYLNFMPLSGVILSALILHETITFRQISAGILILAGVLYAEKEAFRS